MKITNTSSTAGDYNLINPDYSKYWKDSTYIQQIKLDPYNTDATQWNQNTLGQGYTVTTSSFTAEDTEARAQAQSLKEEIQALRESLSELRKQFENINSLLVEIACRE